MGWRLLRARDAAMAVIFVLALLSVDSPTPAQGRARMPVPPPNANGPEQLRDMESRMRVARADADFQETSQAALDMVRLAGDISDRLEKNAVVAADDVKALDRLRKLARRVRGDLGGFGDIRLEAAPKVPRDGAKQLRERAEQFKERFAKSSRYEVDARLIVLAGEIEKIADLLKELGPR